MDAEKMMMQRRIDNLMEQLELVKRERDSLWHDFISLACDGLSTCSLCKHFLADMTICEHTEEIGAEDIGDCFEWRSLCKENGGVEE